jgi:hypothetical protein
MPQWMQDLISGWPMIMANVPTFLVIMALIIGALWATFNWAYGSVIASKNSQIELQDRQLADYKQKLAGATPDQAKAKIEDLEDRVRNNVSGTGQVLITVTPTADIDARKAFFRILESSRWREDQERETKDRSKLVHDWLEVRPSGPHPGLDLAYCPARARVSSAIERAENHPKSSI